MALMLLATGSTQPSRYASTEVPAEDLKTAIRSVSAHILQESVIQLCINVPGATKYLSSALLTPQAPSGAKKVKRSTRWVKCANCEEDFDLSAKRADRECVYHPGELEPDDSSHFWADHDENCHGPIDTDDNKEDYPEGFKWTCCETNGADLYYHSDLDPSDGDHDEARFGAGCRIGWHCEE